MELCLDGVERVKTHVRECAGDSSCAGPDEGSFEDREGLEQGMDFGGTSDGGFEPILRSGFLWVLDLGLEGDGGGGESKIGGWIVVGCVDLLCFFANGLVRACWGGYEDVEVIEERIEIVNGMRMMMKGKGV